MPCSPHVSVSCDKRLSGHIRAKGACIEAVKSEVTSSVGIVELGSEAESQQRPKQDCVTPCPETSTMGNLCSKSANKDDNFSTPGRSLGSSSQNQPTTAPVPQKIPSSTPGRAVGGSQRPGSSSDPKSAAAAAAEGGESEPQWAVSS